jgi:hypothetical protein
MNRFKTFWFCSVVLATACNAPPNQQQFLVDTVRPIAVISEPAELRPNQGATLRITYAAPVGQPLPTQTTWALCLASKAPSEDNVVSPACLDGNQQQLGTSSDFTIAATIPADACARFGPDTPSGDFRPRSADSTGGYYQPISVRSAQSNDADDQAFALVRIVCNLPGAPAQLAQQYARDYRVNVAPSLSLDVPAQVSANAAVQLTATWNDNARESYLWFDSSSASLQNRRESFRISWFVTSGSLPLDATVVDEQSDATSSAITWSTPASVGPVTLWAVMRDSRGGIAIQSATIVVE